MNEHRLTDGQLLARLPEGRETAARCLIQRHGDLVRGVCQRLLDDPGRAREIFHEAFRLLFRAARTLSQRQSVGGWLHATVCRLAMRANNKHGLVDIDALASMQPILDELITRLPLRYRTTLVVCGLEGQSIESAASQLNCGKDQVRQRLDAGLDLLSKRLAKCGIAPADAATLRRLFQEESRVVESLVPRVLAAFERASVQRGGTRS